MTMFMPHGLGHGLGMDVHDCEAMGERSFDFSSIAQRAAKSATCIYRAAWRLEPGTVMTDEPGLYFIPALIDKCRAEGLYKGIVDYDALEGYRDFGGIRIEGRHPCDGKREPYAGRQEDTPSRSRSSKQS